MHRNQEIFPAIHAQLSVNLRLPDQIVIALDDLVDRVSDNVDILAVNTLSQEVHAAAFGIWHKHITTMIDNATIDLFGHAVVVTTVSSLHVVDGNTHTLRDQY